MLVDAPGPLTHAVTRAGDLQHRDGGVPLMATLFGVYAFPLMLYADGDQQGPRFRRGEAGTFVVPPRRRVVERTIAWLNRCLRLVKAWECLNRAALALLRRASIRVTYRGLCQYS